MPCKAKKYPCADCAFCQWCGDDRCRMCLGQKCAQREKLSMREQIELFEALNRQGDKMHEK